MARHCDEVGHLGFSSAKEIVIVFLIGAGGWIEGECHFIFIELDAVKVIFGTVINALVGPGCKR